MFKSIARFGAAFIAAITFSLPTAASTFSIDYTDLWGGGQPVPNENGWGLNLVQQGDIIFATMFVYGADNTPRWFSASGLAPSGGSSTWSGSLAQSTGPFYGAPWTGNAVGTVVGTMTINFANANTGTLTYNVNNQTVQKNISRFTLRGPNLAGVYLGGATARCSNGTDILIFDRLTVTQNSTALTMRVDFFNNQGISSTCTYNGTLSVTGKTGSISGSFSCSFGGQSGNVGSFNISNLDSSINGFNGTFTASDQFCSSMSGRFGGLKDVI